MQKTFSEMKINSERKLINGCLGIGDGLSREESNTKGENVFGGDGYGNHFDCGKGFRKI